MRGARRDLATLGAGLAFVGSGAPAFARSFHDEFVPDCEVYSDPSGQTYAVIGARHGLLATLGPAALLAGLRARRQGFRQTTTQGRPLLQGGVVVMLPGDSVAWSYVSRHAGDHPETARVVEAVRAALAARAADPR